jgi:PAS domain S-box-containing protein
MNDHLNSFNWKKTSLGEKKLWSQTKQAFVNTVLQSKSPLCTLWGEDMVQIYNEAYARILGPKHPAAFGASANETWTEIWEEICEGLTGVFKDGESFSYEDYHLTLTVDGKPKESFFSFYFSPICTAEKNIEGIMVLVTETTDAEKNASQLSRLRDSQLKNVFVQAPLAFSFLSGPDYIVEIANQKILELWGRSQEQVFKKPIFEAVPEAKNQGYEEILHRVFYKGETVVLNEAQLKIQRNGNSEDLFIKVVYEPLREQDGSVSGIMLIADDITEQVKARRAVEESELRQKIAIETAKIGTFRWDIEKSDLQYSERFANLFGYSNNNGLGHQSFAERIHPDDQALRLKAHEIAFETGTLSYEARIVKTDQTETWARFNGIVVFNEDRKPIRMYGTALEIAEEKNYADKLQRLVEERTSNVLQKHEELKKSEERYHKMVEEVQDYAIILLDKDGIIQNWNKGAEKIKQYHESEIVGKSFKIFYRAEDRKDQLPEKLINRAIETGRAVHEGWRLRKDQSKFWGSITLTALHDQQNNIIGFSKVTRDLTERKLAEDKMRQYLIELEAQNRELEQFAYVASHDLQEPLRKIQTFSDVIQQNLHNPPVVANYFKKINSSALRMTELIRSVLNYSRLTNEGEKFTATDLNEILENVKTDFELLLEEKKAVIRSERLPVIKVIPLQINQLFSNLISNALKFSETAPVVTISTRVVSRQHAINLPGYFEDPEYLEISFRDNGIGFEQQYEKVIFTMFQRLHGKHEFSGTGIGLALCKRIMETHSGFVTATSEPGHGATFYLYFPLEKIAVD